MNSDQEEANGDGCEICEEPFSEGETVVQEVQDRYPFCDKEIVLSTYHEQCWNGIESLTEHCNHCKCWFRLVLLQKGKEYQNLSWKLFCPFCGTLFDSQMGC